MRLEWAIFRFTTSPNVSHRNALVRRFQKERFGHGAAAAAAAAAAADQVLSDDPAAALRQRVERFHTNGTGRAGHGLRRGKTDARPALLRVPGQVQRPETEGPHHVLARLEV